MVTGSITECSGLAGTSVGHPAQPPAQAGSPRAGCTGPCPGGAGISPEKETPQPPWAAWARAPAPSEGSSSSSLKEQVTGIAINRGSLMKAGKYILCVCPQRSDGKGLCSEGLVQELEAKLWETRCALPWWH